MHNLGFHLATVLTAAVTSLLAWVSDPATAWITALALGSIAVLQVALARWLFDDRPHPAVSVGFVAVMALALAIACYGSPTAAFFQFAAYPMVWVAGYGDQVRSHRGALLGSAFVAAGVAVGMGPSQGWITAIGTAALSLAVSVAMGLWFTYWARLATERAKLIKQLREAEESTRVWERKAGQQGERERIARDIHDTITQNLTGIVMAAQRGQRHAENQQSAEGFAVIERLAAEGLTDARALASGQRSATDSGELVPTVQRLAADFERETGVRVGVEATLADPLDTETRVVLLRCAQESLANVRKHAQAQSVRIELASVPAGTQLVVVDDGIGLTKAAAPGPREGLGIINMTERVALTGGTVSVDENHPGTIVRVYVPTPGREDDSEAADE